MRNVSRRQGRRSTRRATPALDVGIADAFPHAPEPAGYNGVVERGYLKAAPVVAVVLLGLIMVRLAELIPGAASLRPSFLSALLGGSLVLARTQPSILTSRFGNPVLQAYVFFGAWALVTAPFAIWPGHAIRSLYPVFAPGIVLIVVTSLCTPRLDILDFVARGLVLAFGILFAAILSDNVVWQGQLYWGSLDPNDLGSYAAIAFPFAAMQARRASGLFKWVALATAPLCVYILLLTGSRGGTLAFAATILTLMLVLPGRRRIVAALVVMVAVPAAWSIAPDTFRDRVRSLTNLEADYNTYDYFGRVEVWKRGVRYTIENPVTGVGLGNFDTAEGQVLTSMGQRGKWSAAHSAYIQAFAELGFVGGILFLVLLARTAAVFTRLARNRDPTLARPEYIAALAGFAVGAVFLSHAYFWGLIGLLALGALAHEVLKRQQTRSPTYAVARPVRGAGWRTRRA